jgi:hypothetical protein
MSDTGSQLTSPRPSEFENRYRLYLDESGDHVFRSTIDPSHRFLCLLGCWFRNPDYLAFHQSLEELKARHFPHHPDNPVVLHREEIMNARGPFKTLRDKDPRSRFDDDLLTVISAANFKIVAVVIDKRRLLDAYGKAAAHPYHLGLGFLLQRYCGFLNHINRTGDVMAESRGGKEDRLLKESYEHVYERGAWRVNSSVFQSSLTSKELKLKQKSANIAGLQLSDLLGHPVKQSILSSEGALTEGLAPFAKRLVEAVGSKFNRHLYEGRVQGYGTVFFPKK